MSGGRPRRGLGYERDKKQQQRPFEDDLLDTRRTKREMIGKAGTAAIWGKSPPHPELSSDDEISKRDKKAKKKRKKEEKKLKKSKKGKKSKKAKKVKKKKKKKDSSSSDSDSSDESSSDGVPGDEVWIEKSDADQFKKPSTSKSSKSKRSSTKDDADDESQIGPAVRNTSGLSHKDFGHALLPGEGAAMVSTPTPSSTNC